eukprot:scaffold222_cov90-Skeletonema_menzelii.AAC.4
MATKHDDEANRALQQYQYQTFRLLKHGVDIQVYFDGVINGPHCIKFVDNGIKIIRLIKKKLVDIVEDEEMKRAMSTFGEKFEKVLTYTQLIQAQLMSTKIQDAEVFKTNRDHLRRAIVDLVGFSE